MRRRALILALLVALVALAPAGAYAKRTVPRGFYGTNWDRSIKERSGAPTKWGEWARMQRVGVESARTNFIWGFAQEQENGPIDFQRTDNLTWLAASHDIELLPTVVIAPNWARERKRQYSPPKSRHAYARYLTALIERYGPKGTFWPEHPELTKRPIRTWQLWNEPNLYFYWPVKGDWAEGYGKLVRTSYKAIKNADPGAKVVLAGLTNRSWSALERLYEKGDIHGAFDIAALHPFTPKPKGVVEIVRRFHAVMAKHGDGGKPVWATEIGLPAARGHDTDPAGDLATTNRGMARFLTDTYAALTAARRTRATRVDRAYWYTWASGYKSKDPWDYAGLLKHAHYTYSESMVPKPALDAYEKSALKAEGR
jgi:polysaccharide biosynthesis protein PslG